MGELLAFFFCRRQAAKTALVERSRYAIRLYAWAQEHRSAGSKRITLERLRTVLGLDSIKDPKGKVIRKAPLPVWANLRQRALDVAIAQIKKKTDLNITLESLERAAHRLE